MSFVHHHYKVKKKFKMINHIHMIFILNCQMSLSVMAKSSDGTSQVPGSTPSQSEFLGLS
jgi:hypothetical protein